MEDKPMKNLRYHLLVAVATTLALLSFSITNAVALSIIYNKGENNEIEIYDNQVNDNNPAAGIIDFHIVFPGKLIIIGTVLEERTLLPNNQIQNTVTLTRTLSSGIESTDYTLSFESSSFSQPPIDTGTVHLEGTYHSLTDTIGADSSVSFEGFLNSIPKNFCGIRR